MKKLLLIGGAVLTLAAVGCKKDYTCECTATSAGISVSASYTTKDTKKNAETWCEGYNASSSAGGITTTTTCTLK
ncbi:MAG: hypothetical protein MRY83_01810 [Flavobacteriales bacterium]|nr:hypothetical protein [Flavobacteriales bacterium]